MEPEGCPVTTREKFPWLAERHRQRKRERERERERGRGKGERQSHRGQSYLAPLLPKQPKF